MGNKIVYSLKWDELVDMIEPTVAQKAMVLTDVCSLALLALRLNLQLHKVGAFNETVFGKFNKRIHGLFEKIEKEKALDSQRQKQWNDRYYKVTNLISDYNLNPTRTLADQMVDALYGFTGAKRWADGTETEFEPEAPEDTEKAPTSKPASPVDA